MKEAAGEANLTVVAIILIGVVVAIASPLISNMMNSTAGRACCIDGGGTVSGGKCSGGTYNGKTVSAIASDSGCSNSSKNSTDDR